VIIVYEISRISEPGMRPMKMLLSVILALSAVASQPAAGGWRMFGEQRGEIQAQNQDTQTRRRPPPREIRAPERPPPQDGRQGGRLTEEERRALRRDIDRANREIYKGQQR